MHIHDEDDDPPDLFRQSSDASRDDAPDEDEMTAPDDFATVRCTRCRKLIFEDAEQCPYCKHWQAEDERSRKPLWFILTAILCIAMLSGLGALLLLGRISWRIH
jgi:hypothetical protein